MVNPILKPQELYIKIFHEKLIKNKKQKNKKFDDEDDKKIDNMIGPGKECERDIE